MQHKRLDTLLEPLDGLTRRIAAVAELSLPDFPCMLPALQDQLCFVALDLDEHPSGLGGEEISLQINGVDHLFTDWSRLQLLAHLGTREKWFSRVTLTEQARELTRRTHTFDRQVFRTMRTYNDINYVRGLISAAYVDIPDLEVMQALAAVMLDGESLYSYSGKSDKAFYAYALMRQAPIGFGQGNEGYPGVVVKNSEVGACALSVVPFFMLTLKAGFMAPVVMRRYAMYRKIHRGRLSDLRPSLTDALEKLQAVWSPLQKRLDGLQAKIFPDEAAAIDRLETALQALRCQKNFIQKCTTTYSGAKNTAHNGLTLFTAVLTSCASKHLDGKYDDAEVAGALLLQLL